MKNKIMTDLTKDKYIKQLEDEIQVLNNQLEICNRPVYCVDCKNYMNTECKYKDKCNFNDPTHSKQLLDRPYYRLKPYYKLLREKDNKKKI